MDEYIRREDALKGQRTGTFANGICFEAKPCVLVDYIESIESADVVPVVRCKDCKHVYCRTYHGRQEPIYTCTHLRSRWNINNDLEVNPDDFCSYGERKED